MPAALRAPSAWRHPLQAARAQMQRFWLNRLQPSERMTLTQRTVYILPTRPGWMLGLTLLVLLVASINYQLNLGYVLTFLLAGCALVGIHVGHGTLRGLRLHLSPPEPAFAGSSLAFVVHLENPDKTPRYGIGLALLGSDQWTWADVPAGATTQLSGRWQPPRRGLHPLPPLTLETRYPLGSFRVWTVWRPAAQALVYPAPEERAPPLPPGAPGTDGPAAARPDPGSLPDGVRAYQRGDPLKWLVWKKMAQTDQPISRDHPPAPQRERWIDLQHSASAGGLEQRLARLCAWVLEAHRQGLHYGLRLGSQTLGPDQGEAHLRNCLRALALYPGA